MIKSHKRLYFSLSLIIASSFLLFGCASSNNSEPWIEKQKSAPLAAEQIPNDLSVAAVEQFSLDNASNNDTIKVALLLPLSGQHAKLGNAMLNSAQMALFDIGFDNFELLPRDTKGTATGAQNAAQNAINDGAKLILGPVFSHSVKSVQKITNRANINMIAFSTDWHLARNNTFLIGFLPFNQVERVINFASLAGYKRLAVLSPQNSYGNSVSSAYKSLAHRAGIDASTSKMASFSPKYNSLSGVIKDLSNYDARKAAENIDEVPFDAILMPMGGTTARQAGSFLNHYDLPPHKVKRLGTGLMDDKSLASDKSLDGTWFAAPDPQNRKKFERKYNNLYLTTPPRLASLSYDATALSIILARIGLQDGNIDNAFRHSKITNPNGFFGMDGIFRFRPDGIVERGLAVLEYQKGNIVVIDNAPKTFQQQNF